MKKIISFLLGLIITLTSLVILIPSETHAAITKGYFKKNGTYISPYLRSKPDKYKFNNYSCYTKGKCF